MESFEITDYDLDQFTTRSQRKLSKRQQMLRTWADDGREDELSTGVLPNKDPKNYTVKYLAGIVQVGRSKEEG